MLKKVFTTLFLSFFLFLNINTLAFAVPTPVAGDANVGTILPAPIKGQYSTVEECTTLLMEPKDKLEGYIQGEWGAKGQSVLACGIKTGQIRLWMVPYYIRFILEFVIQISGLACVAATVYGGFLYLFAGISEDKDKGKKAITYGIIGMIITFLAWAIVNIFIIFLTGA